MEIDLSLIRSHCAQAEPNQGPDYSHKIGFESILFSMPQADGSVNEIKSRVEEIDPSLPDDGKDLPAMIQFVARMNETSDRIKVTEKDHSSSLLSERDIDSAELTLESYPHQTPMLLMTANVLNVNETGSEQTMLEASDLNEKKFTTAMGSNIIDPDQRTNNKINTQEIEVENKHNAEIDHHDSIEDKELRLGSNPSLINKSLVKHSENHFDQLVESKIKAQVFQTQFEENIIGQTHREDHLLKKIPLPVLEDTKNVAIDSDQMEDTIHFKVSSAKEHDTQSLLAMDLHENKAYSNVISHEERLTVRSSSAEGAIREPYASQILLNKIDSMLLLSQNQAHIVITPPELGEIEIDITHTNEKIDIQFSANLETTRALIESQLIDLSISLDKEGIELGNVSVGQQDKDGPKENDHPPRFGQLSAIEDIPQENLRSIMTSTSLLDIYI